MTLVSVVIPTYNRAAQVGAAIESVLSVHRHNFEVEVIVVDDGSTDGTEAVIARYPVSYMRTFGARAAGARNAGLKAAHGEFVAFLDDDDIWLPGNITPQLKAFASNPAYGAVHAQVLRAAPDNTPYGEPLPSGPLSSGWIFDDLLEYWPQIGSLLIRRSVLQEIGGFDQTLRSDAEDWDLILRIARHYPVGRVEESVLLFRQRDRDEVQRYLRMCDTFAVFRRHTRSESLWRRMALYRSLWRHRGWFTSQFITTAQARAGRGEFRQTLRCLRYALIASPPHALLRDVRFWQAVVVLIRAGIRAPRLYDALLL